jgi:hypothetical protein
VPGHVGGPAAGQPGQPDPDRVAVADQHAFPAGVPAQVPG